MNNRKFAALNALLMGCCCVVSSDELTGGLSAAESLSAIDGHINGNKPKINNSKVRISRTHAFRASKKDKARRKMPVKGSKSSPELSRACEKGANCTMPNILGSRGSLNLHKGEQCNPVCAGSMRPNGNTMPKEKKATMLSRKISRDLKRACSQVVNDGKKIEGKSSNEQSATGSQAQIFPISLDSNYGSFESFSDSFELNHGSARPRRDSIKSTAGSVTLRKDSDKLRESSRTIQSPVASSTNNEMPKNAEMPNETPSPAKSEAVDQSKTSGPNKSRIRSILSSLKRRIWGGKKSQVNLNSDAPEMNAIERCPAEANDPAAGEIAAQDEEQMALKPVVHSGGSISLKNFVGNDLAHECGLRRNISLRHPNNLRVRKMTIRVVPSNSIQDLSQKSCSRSNTLPNSSTVRVVFRHPCADKDDPAHSSVDRIEHGGPGSAENTAKEVLANWRVSRIFGSNEEDHDLLNEIDAALDKTKERDSAMIEVEDGAEKVED